MSGNPITGYYTGIESGGSVVQTGFTPLSYQANPGTAYTVTVQDYGDFVFDHWENGSTDRTRVITPSESSTIMAYYTS